MLLLAACTPSHEHATYEDERTRVSVSVTRARSNNVLPEYRRWIFLEGDDWSRSAPLFPDTGGYSRTNLYRIDDRTLLLRDAEGSYEIRVSPPTITKDAVRRRTGEFLGSFDVDTSGTWRFFAAAVRPEQPVEFKER